MMASVKVKRFAIQPLPKIKAHDTEETLKKYGANNPTEMNPLSRVKKVTSKQDEKGEKAAAEGAAKGEFKVEINEETLSVAMLKEGKTQSFVDFFYITHNCTPNTIIGAESNEREEDGLELELKAGLDEMGFERSKDNLLKLKDMLVQAEDSLGFVKKAESIEEYISLAEFFDKIDSKVAAFFYKRCIVMAKETLDREWQCRAEYGYGLCHDRLGKREESINLLEDALELSKNEGLSGIPERICKKLVEIYKEVALFYENKTQEDFKFSDMALDYYEKCLKMCDNEDLKVGYMKGEVANKMGSIYLLRGEKEKSIQYQKQYLEWAKASTDKDQKKNEMEAHSSLGKSYLAIGKLEEAQEHYEQYLDIAKEQNTKSLNSQADASHSLADLHWKKNNQKKALEYYKAFFENAKNEKEKKDRRMIDTARIANGLAKGSFNIESHLKLITESAGNIRPLLEWKGKKDK